MPKCLGFRRVLFRSLTAGPRAAVAPGVPGTSLPSSSRPALDIPETMSQFKGRPRRYQGGPSSRAGTRSRADGNSLESWLAGSGDDRRLVRGGDLLLRQRPRSAAKSVSRFVGATRL